MNQHSSYHKITHIYQKCYEELLLNFADFNQSIAPDNLKINYLLTLPLILQINLHLNLHFNSSIKEQSIFALYLKLQILN